MIGEQNNPPPHYGLTVNGAKLAISVPTGSMQCQRPPIVKLPDQPTY